MSINSICKVCGSGLVFEEDVVGGKVECAHCHSVLRVKTGDRGGIELCTLIESLDFAPVEAVAEAGEPVASDAPKIKLKSWKDKLREDGAESVTRRTSRTRSRR